MLALRAFNVETAIIPEHIRSREAALLQVREDAAQPAASNAEVVAQPCATTLSDHVLDGHVR
jgi:hypothetical protein